jgi:hypothetical protein
MLPTPDVMFSDKNFAEKMAIFTFC